MASSSTSPTPFLYSCIAAQTTILAEHTASPSSNTSSLASVILPKISHNASSRLTYTHNANLIHYIADGPATSTETVTAPGLTFLVVARQDLGQRIAFAYLADVRKRFLGQYDPSRTEFGSLPPYGAAAFNSKLKELMGEYGSGKGTDAFGRAQKEIDEAKGVMTQNIERVLERGER